MRKFIAGIEIIAGILVLILFIFSIGVRMGASGQGIEYTPWSWNFFLPGFIVIVFGLINLIAGINLWRNKTSGYIMSIIAQGIQLISVQAPNFHNVFYTILGFIISFSKTGVMTMFGLGAAYEISLNPHPVTTTFIGINIIALILLSIIIILYRKTIRIK